MSDDLRTVVLRIEEPQGDASPYPVRLVLDPGGDATTLAEHELERALPPGLQSAREVVVSDDEVGPETVKEIGAALHAALGSAGVAWRDRAWRDDGDDTEARVLLDVRPGELALLPWEMLFDPDPMLYPFGRTAVPAARVSRAYRPGATRPEREYWPLRILVVVGTHDATVMAAQEVALMEDALVRLCADIDLEVIDPPAREDLLAALEERRPHILHFIGHGIVGEDGLGALELAPEGRDKWEWTASDIRMDLPDKPRLVVVNACRTGGLQAHDGTMSVARAFLEEDVPAVIAMQGPIDGAAAARFSGGLYSALADGAPLDLAVTRGRQGIASKQDVKWDSRETWLPILTLGVPPDAVLPPRYRVQSTRANQIRKLVRPLGPFVDRRDDRRTILSRLEVRDGPGEDGDEHEHLFLVSGDRKTGKTVLVKWAVSQLGFRGEAAVYVNLASGKERPRFGFVMEQIRRAMCDTLWAGQAETPLDEFAQRLERLNAIEGQPTDEQKRELCVALVNALGPISETSQLVIALDQVEEVFQQDYAELLAQKLLRPVAEGAAGRTRVVLVHHGDTASVLNELRPVPMATLGGIEARTVKPYLRQYILYHGDVDEVLVAGILSMVDRLDKAWMPTQFAQLTQGLGIDLDPQALP